ncbi:MAG: FAD-dependent oxidoreductase [Enterococcus sp.]
MSRKIVVIGGVAGGASAAARVRRLDEQAEIIIFEKGPHVSFSNCALPYFLSKTIQKAENLVLLTPNDFKKQYNILAKTSHEVLAIDHEKKEVTVLDQQQQVTFTENYDELILSPGAKPIRPEAIQGSNGENVFTVRNVGDIQALDRYLFESQAKRVTVVGGGFVGLEIAENLVEAGFQITIVESQAHLLKNLDEDFAQLVHKQIVDHKISLVLDTTVTKITNETIELTNGKTFASDVVVLAVGVAPEVDLAKRAGITLGSTGAIKVNQHFQTNLDHVYAIGDAIEVTEAFTHKKIRQNLAFAAQIQARKVVDHLYGRKINTKAAIGSQVLRIFDLNVASTGLTEAYALANGIDARSVTVIPKDKVPLFANARPLHLKLVFSYPEGKILGAQALGESQVDKQINIIATAIRYGGSIEDLEDLELCYQPLFSTAKNAVNTVALVANNILNGEFQQVPVTKVRELVTSGAFILDVREENEFAEGHIVNAYNIPLTQFRERLTELPTNQPIYVHCLSSQRSYYVVRALNQLGFKAVYNIVGSFLGLSEYEYYHDSSQERRPIVTNYRFDLL